MSKKIIRARSKKDYVRKCLVQSYKGKEHIPASLYSNVRFSAPDNFSLIENPIETTHRFNELISFVCSVKDFVIIHYDLSNVNSITIDAIIYMIALSINIKNKYRTKYNIVLPKNKELREFILSSGIEKMFNAEKVKIQSNDNFFCIRMGRNTDVDIAKELCDFTTKRLNKDFKYSRFLYDMLIEMMTNAGHHAYAENNKIQTQWFIFAEDSEESIKYTFIDTGMGIPASMSKHILSVTDLDIQNDYFINNILKRFSSNESSDTILLLSGLRPGGFRTRTEKSYRGKGLPEIYAYYYDEKKTSNLKIISGACHCSFNDGNREVSNVIELSEKFEGTLFYWEIEKDNKKGEHQ